MSTITIAGYLVGPNWYGYESFKPFELQFHNRNLRGHVQQITNDADFDHCAIACGELRIEHHSYSGRTHITRSKTWDLEYFPSIKDCLCPDQDWFPPLPYDDDE